VTSFFGAWFLNYAPSGRDMVDMFRNVALNLRDGGHFVGVTPPPTQDPTAFVEAERQARPGGSRGGGVALQCYGSGWGWDHRPCACGHEMWGYGF